METKTKILVVDDDRENIKKVQSHLESMGYEVVTAQDGRAGLQLVRSEKPDLVVLDINFPESKGEERTLDGIEVLQRLCDAEDDTRVLMLSSTNVAAIKVMALTMGADDYLAKPFSVEELSARINAILRRTSEESAGDAILEFKRLKLDSSERRVWKDGQPLDLSKLEFDMLFTLARRPNHVFSREKLLELAWENTSFSGPKVVDVHIGHIRKKIEDDASAPALIATVRGTGYRFEDEPLGKQ